MLEIDPEQGKSNSDSNKQEEKVVTPASSSASINTQDSQSTMANPSSAVGAHHQCIAEAIAEGLEAARLPTPQLTVFNGDPLNWPTWKAAFETVIEERTVNSNEKNPVSSTLLVRPT